MSILRILLADDHEGVRKAIRSVLERHTGWEVCGEAVDGWDAVEKAKSLKPDVVLLDIRMPKLSGLEVTSVIKQELPGSVILILSQLNPGQMLALALVAGAQGFVSKDRAEYELVPAIERIVGRENPFDSPAGLPELTASSSPRSENNTRDFLAGGGEMGALMRSMDWSATPLGPTSSWSTALRMMVRFLLANRFPLLLWWGPKYCQLYNDPYLPILGAKHPKSVGQPASECWPEIWHIIGSLIDSPFQGGPATWMEDILLELHRHDFPDEAHFTIAYSPVPDDSSPSGIGGVLATMHETTAKVVGDRRVAALRDLGARSADAKSTDEACLIAAEALAYHTKDIPFALMYLIHGDRDRAHLAASCGVEEGIDSSPCVIDLREMGNHHTWPLQEVVHDDRMVLIEDLASRFKTVPRGPWSDPPHSAALVPIRSNIAHQLAGVLVAGISSRLRFDERYGGFLDLVGNQVATTVANARAYEEERKRAEALAEVDQAKTAFFSNVSHEFRTPLTLVMGPLEDILGSPNGTLSPSHRQQLTVAHRNSMRLLKLVNHLLDFSRIEAGRVEAVYQPTDISTFTEDLASSFRSAMERAGLGYDVRCDPISEKVFIDHDMWEKIVLNLISNAFKFTFKGTVSVSVTLVGHSVELQVRDTGTGIPKHELPHLFERFHRVGGARGRSFEGTGIGLALVQELVHLHQGSVRVSSREEVGTSFTVTIPRGSSHLPQDRIGVRRTLASSFVRADSYVEEALRWLPGEFTEILDGLSELKRDPSASTVSSLADNVTPRRAAELIVLADDNADLRDYIRRLLGEHYRVHSVSNGLDAVQAAREFDADLVLTDVMMPGLDGFGVLKALRSDPRTCGTPVILLSARAGEESQVEGLQAGADDYLVKPFTARELLARVGAHLKMARIRNDAAKVEARLRAEVELERNRLSDSFTQAPAAMAILTGPDHRFVFANGAYLKMAGRNLEQLLGKTVRQAFPEFEGQGFFELLDRVYQTAEPFVAAAREVRLERGGKEESFYIDFTYHPMRNGSGDVEGILFQGVDVTEQVGAREQLEARVRERTSELQQAQDTLRALNHRLLETQEEERRRLAVDLHDSAGQWLAALKWKMAPLQDDIAPLSTDLAGRVSECLTLLNELGKELRTLSHLLHPPMLDDAGLSPALRSYLEGFAERSGLTVKLELGPDSPRLPREIETAVFRIVQESLTNIHRHARSQTATVRIDHDSEQVRVKVWDCGEGIPNFISLDATPLKMGVGLRGMRERVQQLDGNFDLQSGRGGTTLSVTLPIQNHLFTINAVSA